MLFGIPLAIWFGTATIISLFITAGFGYATYKGKNVFRYHVTFALITMLLALTHAVLAFLLWFFNITL